MTDTPIHFSKSEEAGIAHMPADAKTIYSVGISTGGVAEIRMAQQLPDAHLVATTVDEKGIEFARQRIQQAGLHKRIETKVEDVAKPLPYTDGFFDYIYARLVLHYLPKNELRAALGELHRVLRPGGSLFVVVRSTKCDDATREGAAHNDATGLTTCTVTDPDGRTYSYARYFHTPDTISDAIKAAGFNIESAENYDEQLFEDFMRTKLAQHVDNVIQVTAEK